jgi:hypothetical protein
MAWQVLHTSDFEVTGDGRAAAWERAAWVPLTPVGRHKHAAYETRAKLLWSDTGIYALADCEDRLLTSTHMPDFADLWKEDVIEFFVWPDEAQPLYFEYEISPFNAELPILVPNHQGRFMGWRPWHYEGPRQTRKAAVVRGGPATPGAEITGWSVEFFIPFALLVGLGNVPPQHGGQWRANFYRIDHDQKPSGHYAWTPMSQLSYHLYKEFGTLAFE